jgi:hypothetical protein
MDCHEALMARRRKKTGRNPTSRSKLSTNVHLDKSLPAIPPPESNPMYQDLESEYGQPYASPPLDVPSVSTTAGALRRADSRSPEPQAEPAQTGKSKCLALRNYCAMRVEKIHPL